MAFTLNNWACISSSMNEGQITVTPFGGSPTVENAPNVFTYGSPGDTIGTVSAANYFLSMYASLSVGDWILASGSDASNILLVTAVSPTSVTVGSFGASGTVGTANIINNAVTYAKMQQASVGDVLLGNPTGGVANYQEVTLGTGLAFVGSALTLASNVINYAEVSLSAAQFNGMYAAPVLLVAAAGANQLLVVDKLVLEMTYGTVAYAAGGFVAAQYSPTINGAGLAATNTETSVDFFTTASTSFVFNGAIGPLPFANTVNEGIYLSNVTGAFTTGDSTFTAKVWYKIIPSNA